MQKDGLHLYFNIYVSHSLHESIRNDLLGIMHTFFYYKEESDLDDKILNHNGLILCGACKPDKKPYHITNIFHYNGLEWILNPCELAINEQLNMTIIRVDEIATELFEEAYQHINTQEIERSKNKKRKSRSNNMEFDVEKYTNVHVKYAKLFANLLSKKRMSDYDSWMETGCTLYNISPGLYTVFDDISKKSTKGNYDPYRVYTVFYSTNADHEHKRGLGSLINDAKKDQPNKASAYIKNMQKELNDETRKAEAYTKLCDNFSAELNHALQLNARYQWVTDEYNDVCQTTLKDSFDVIAHLQGIAQDENISEFYSSVRMQNNRLQCTNKNGDNLPLRAHDLKELFKVGGECPKTNYLFCGKW